METGGGETYLAGMFGPNNPYAMYNYIDFGSESPTQFHVNAASDTSGGTIEVRLDSLNGPVIAAGTVSGTGGWQNFKVFSADVTTPVTGKHIVFISFKGGDWLYNFDKFTFGDPAVFTEPAPPTIPEEDDVAPGEVENVQVKRGEGSMTLYWDGPYDIDAQKVQITLRSDGQQVGDVIEVNRGIQTAVIQGIEAGKDYSLFIRSKDLSGNVSQGITLEVTDSPAFSLTVNGKSLQDGDSMEDYTPLRFKILDSSIRFAEITIDGKAYTLDPMTMDPIDIDLAGNLGDKTATITTEDRSGNKLQKNLRFRVITSVNSMKQLVERFADSGDVRGPLIPQLSNALNQAQHHLDKGRRDQAAKHMQNFAKHLNKEVMGRHVSDQAKAVLNTDADFLIQDWQDDLE